MSDLDMAGPYDEAVPPDPVDPDRLLALALSDPDQALAQAREILTGRPDALLSSAAHQTIGVVLRQFGAIDEAVRELRHALRAARRAGDDTRVADIAASLGLAQIMAGRSRAGLRTLDVAVESSQGTTRGRVLIRRAKAHWLFGQHTQGLADAQQAVVLLRADEPMWLGRAVAHRAMLHLALGATAQAERDYERAEALFQAAGQLAEAAMSRLDRGLAAHALGDLPRALALLGEAEQLFATQGIVEPDLASSRCEVLLAAGLAREAPPVAEAALAYLQESGGAPAMQATLLRLAAQAAMAAGDLATATRRSTEALQLYQRQQRPRGADEARLVLLQCRVREGRAGAADLNTLTALAARLDHHDVELAGRAHLLAAGLATTLGRVPLATEQLQLVAGKRHGSTSAQVAAWAARAMLHATRGADAAMLRACDSGLKVIDTHLSTLGASELRSVATAQGADLATMALRHAVNRGKASLVLDWSERWRAVTLSIPPVRPPDDEELTAELAALRLVTRRLVDEDLPHLHRERRRLESAVRARVLRTSGDGGAAETGAGSSEVLAALDRMNTGAPSGTGHRTELVELTTVDGELYAVHAVGGALELHRVGPAAEAERALAQTLFMMRREATGRGRIRIDLDTVGLRLQRALLGEVADRLSADDVVVIPTGQLHAVPWLLLPALRGRAVVVAPSATTWLRARAIVSPEPRRVLLVAGPGLAGGTDEVAALAERYPQARVLTGADATAERVLHHMDGAWLVHLAAHGRFRSDNPLFSAVELADGPLTGYDLERLRQAPHHMVMSSCSSATSAPTGADELMGIVTPLVSRGCAGVVASVVPVNDPATVPLMLALHQRLTAGTSLPQALSGAGADVEAADLPAARVTAGSFVAMGC